MTEYLFTLTGECVAFRRTETDRFVFDLDGGWVGWLPYPDRLDVHHRTGRYVATIVGERLVTVQGGRYRPLPPVPTHPGRPALPERADRLPEAPAPPEMGDVPRWLLSERQALHAADGRWVAYRVEEFVFGPDGTWLGWLTADSDLVRSPASEYVGQIVGDRFLRGPVPDGVGRLARPKRPPAPVLPERVADLPAADLPEGWSDVTFAG